MKKKHPAPPRQPAPGKALLYTTVAITGAAVMIIELLGTRIIGPFYGVSLYVWSSLIAVTMIALALGYYLGGFFADHYPRLHIGHWVAAAALSTAAIPLASAPVLSLSDALGMRGGAFASALLLFTLPLTCLAMAGPYVIKLSAKNLDGIGGMAGSVYAVSTLGSVCGTLLLGFYLLPQFGTRAIITCLSAVLLALAVWLWLRIGQMPWRRTAGLAVIVLAGLLAAAEWAQSARQTPDFQVLSATESLYGWVRVVDDEKNGFRLLLSDGSVLSAVDRARRSLLGYQTVLELLPLARPSGVNNALLIGLGGGHVAQRLKAQGIATDTIEIDPAVAEAAQQFFNFKPTGDFIVGDARYAVKHLAKRYDLIIHDCFTGGTEPVHLLTVEMLRELRGLLSVRGVLALNYVGFMAGEGHAAVAAVQATLKAVFPHLRVFMTEKEELTDFILVASADPLDIDPASTDRRLQWLLAHEHPPTKAPGLILTDDYNPLDSMQTRKAEVYRQKFMERIALGLALR